MSNELNVAILLEDIAEAKTLSQCFRKLGIIPHYYESLKDYWLKTANKTVAELPDFNIIDVKMMSEGDLVLEDHPHIKSKDLIFAFYYNDMTQPLLGSTYDIFNYGFIRKANDYEGQLKLILERVNRFHVLSKGNIQLKKQVQDLQRKSAKLIGTVHDHKEKNDYHDQIINLVEELETQLPKKTFQQALSHVLDSWELANNFSMYEIAPNHKRLVSEPAMGMKYKALPSLWLGQIAETGIERYAEDMANQVAVDILGNNMATLRIAGAKRGADILLYLKVREEVIMTFNWGLLSRLISGVYRRNLLHKQNEKESLKASRADKMELNAYELLTSLEDEFRTPNNLETRALTHQLAAVTFADLLGTIKDRPHMKFDWRDFFEDFIYQIEREGHRDFHYSHAGPGVVYFFTSSDRYQKFFHDLTEVAKRFPYWRYFDDGATVLGLELAPDVKGLPFTPQAYQRHLDLVFQNERIRVSKRGLHQEISEEARANVNVVNHAPLGARRPSLDI